MENTFKLLVIEGNLVYIPVVIADPIVKELDLVTSAFCIAQLAFSQIKFELKKHDYDHSENSRHCLSHIFSFENGSWFKLDLFFNFEMQLTITQYVTSDFNHDVFSEDTDLLTPIIKMKNLLIKASDQMAI